MSNTVIHDLVSEMLGRLPSGGGIVAVDGDAAEQLSDMGSQLARDISARGLTSAVQAFTGADFEYSPAGTDVVLVVGEGALQPGVRTRWNWTLWVEASGVRDPASNDRSAVAFESYRSRDEPRGAASAIVDVSDPAAYRRHWNDACSI
ncbi:hypothetical protein EDF18_1311 [Frigoribacterium sp. PhB107]|uniref:hypothetical protein n=1 Tax=Frigoribacterium sp. PhB107 TaxID=2485172 RepID=UPI000F4A38A6|nr:hypothetical protein [Frigoribacterium sp. PhB107]ROP78656.1 hypothetical protein EDF18_1311 [Frigoribacterium sp. PhB107]